MDRRRESAIPPAKETGPWDSLARGKASSEPPWQDTKGTAPPLEWDLAEAISIAREAADRREAPPPLGGDHWTPEDIDVAASMVLEAGEVWAYRKANDRGMTARQRRAYLRKALLHRLRDDASAAGRSPPVDSRLLDARPCDGVGAKRLAPSDATHYAGRVVARLSAPARRTIRPWLRSGSLPLPDERKTRSQHRHLAELGQALRSVAHEAKLTGVEEADVLSRLLSTFP